jgi:hypothetical protein
MLNDECWMKAACGLAMHRFSFLLSSKPKNHVCTIHFHNLRLLLASNSHDGFRPGMLLCDIAKAKSHKDIRQSGSSHRGVDSGA